MIRINQLKLSIDHTEDELKAKIYKVLKRKTSDKIDYHIAKRSIDARKKPNIYYVYAINVLIDNEAKIVQKLHDPSIVLIKEKIYQYPQKGGSILHNPPIIIGAGPAGLFCAYILTEMGYHPIVLERGKTIENRKKEVEDFWKTGVLNTESNVQFGEGGAGTFSDGKLNSVVKDPKNRNLFVLQTFVKFGAPEQILYDNKPHIGTDILSKVIVSMRKYLEDKGCIFQFECCVKDFVIQGGKIRAVICGEKKIETDVLVLAPGHSSRDTFRRLHELQIPMAAKNFAVGFRVEHPQEMIDRSQYGDVDLQKLNLPASPYKVTANFPNGRGVYSFCMCPGGYVVNSSSEEERTVVNGMSYSGRNGKNANSAIIVSVGPEDFGSADVLAGMEYQERLEHQTYLIGKGDIPQQLFGDYCKNEASKSYGAFQSETKGKTVFTNLRGLLSEEIEETFIAGMHHFSNIIKDYDRADAIMSGIESRTSSPIRIHRNEFFESDIQGLYPCGEGAGYAGGIMSAAMDGMKVAEAIIMKYKEEV